MTKNALRLHVVMQSSVMEYAEQSKDKDAYMMSCCEYVEKQEVLMTNFLACELIAQIQTKKKVNGLFFIMFMTQKL